MLKHSRRADGDGDDDEFDEYEVEEWYVDDPDEHDRGDFNEQDDAGLPPDMTGRSVLPFGASTVSSMTSVDSYVLQQKRLCEARMERLLNEGWRTRGPTR